MVPWESDTRIFGTAFTGQIKYIKTEIPPLHISFSWGRKNSHTVIDKACLFSVG